NLTPAQSGSLVTWTLIGAVVGGIVFGALSDRYGRVRVLTWTIVLFAVFTGLCAIAQGYWDLLIYRTIAGIGLGGEFGIGMALAIEAWPAKHRAKAASYVALGWQVGVLAAALLTPVLLPHIGWRGMFVVGIFPAFVAWYLRVRLHEPEIFSQKQTELSTQKISKLESFKLLVKDKATTKVSLGIVVLTSVQNFGYYGIMIWMPNFLSKQLGFSLTKSGLWTAVTVCSIITYSQLTDPTAMLVAGAFLGMFVNGMMGGYGALMAEAYPTEARATAQNVLFNLGRAVGGFGPVVVGAIVSAYSFSIAIAFLAVIYVIDMVATVFLVPELKGKELS
ncbi:MAG: MFS transporter, partial [Haemophilus parainfluenzae]|nr:MFS transporter [Haemophilus parainfluenzae]